MNMPGRKTTKLAADRLPTEYQLASLLCKERQLRFVSKDLAKATPKWSAALAGKDMPSTFTVDEQINSDDQYCFYTTGVPGRLDREIRNEVLAMAKRMFEAQGIPLVVLRPYDANPVFVVPAETLTTDEGKRRMAAVYTTAKEKNGPDKGVQR